MKKNFIQRILSFETLLSLVFFAAAFVFFGYFYPFHLNYQEQFQLFLFTSDYFAGFINHPGGLADYLGTFLTQFYFYSKIGAVILALVLTVLQLLIWTAAKRLEASRTWQPLTFLPSMFYWGLLCDENYLLGGLVSMFLLAYFINLFLLFQFKKTQSLVSVILLIALYWFAGGVYIPFALFMLGVKLLEKKEKSKKNIISVALGLLIVVLLLPFLAKALVVQYPLSKFVVGTTYFRFPVSIPLTIVIIAFLIFALPLLLSILSQKLHQKKPLFIGGLLTAILLIFGFFFIKNKADFEKEEIMAYDFHIRMRKWDRAIALANEKEPTSPLSVTCLNLALAKQDLLGERMFMYYQNGISGLIPDFTRDFTIPMIAGEVYYHLGLVNTAQRFAFEAMEALPNYQKSARSVKRLAETNIINGEYTLAKKYLHLLQKTFYYRGWATQSLEILKDEKMVEDHLEWGWLRKARIQNDFLFSEQEKENMLGQLFTHNPENRMAFEYLLASALLKKDLQSFINYYPLSKSLDYKVIPKHFQEALLYVWEVTNEDKTKTIPYPISSTIKARLDAYKRLYGNTRDARLMQKDFDDTYWYYFHFKN